MNTTNKNKISKDTFWDAFMKEMEPSQKGGTPTYTNDPFLQGLDEDSYQAAPASPGQADGYPEEGGELFSVSGESEGDKQQAKANLAQMMQQHSSNSDCEYNPEELERGFEIIEQNKDTIRSVGTSYGVPPETIASILLLQQHAGTEKNDAEFRKNATSELDYEMQKKLANDTEFNIHAIGAVLSVIADHFGVQQELREKDRKALNQILADFTMGKGLPDCYENGGDSKAKEFADQVNDCMEDVRVLLS